MHVSQAIKQLIKKNPSVFLLLQLFFHPRREFANLWEYIKFRRRFHGFSREQSVAYKGKLLIVCFHGAFTKALQEEGIFILSSAWKGLEPVVVTYRGGWATAYYRLFGVKKFVYFDDLLLMFPRADVAGMVDQALLQIRSFDELMAYTFHDVHVGKFIASSLVRKTYTGTVDVLDPVIRESIREYLFQTFQNTMAAERVYQDLCPDAILLLERGYTPYGEFFDIAMNRKLNCMQWVGSHRENALILKRYRTEISDQHPTSLSEKTWSLLQNMPWNDRRAEQVRQELYQNYQAGTWYSEVGTQFATKMMSRAQIQDLIGLDPAKKTAVIFPHLFWDATFFWGEDLFENYRHWFIETVKMACQNTHLNWVIKIHPANNVKLIRDKYKGELVERMTIHSEIGELPPHIKILQPQTPIATYSLYEHLDYAVTVRGTAGIEAALFGVPVITAGTGRYDRHGFTIDSSSREEYLQNIAKLHTYPRLTPAQIVLAQKFAFGTFLLRPFRFTSMQFSYKRDATATPVIQYFFDSLEDLHKAKDVQALGEWMANSRDEDYIDEAFLTSSIGHTKGRG